MRSRSATHAATSSLALDEALDAPPAHERATGRVVECRFYGGMSVEETAEALDISPATVKRDWATARAWLNRELGRDGADAPAEPLAPDRWQRRPGRACAPRSSCRLGDRGRAPRRSAAPTIPICAGRWHRCSRRTSAPGALDRLADVA